MFLLICSLKQFDLSYWNLIFLSGSMLYGLLYLYIINIS
nr:MAG TPA: hypothetical protein [Caudoviricetes sp.]